MSCVNVSVPTLIVSILLSVRITFSVKSNFVCEGEKLHLRCEKPLAVLRIYAAKYGRTEPGTSICPHINISSTQCIAAVSFKTVTRICANKARCKIWATNNVFGGDPCPGTFKYLDVIYGCVRGTPRPLKTTLKSGITTTTTTTTTVNLTTQEVLNISSLTNNSKSTVSMATSNGRTKTKPEPPTVLISSSTAPPPVVDFAASGQGEKGALMGIIALIYFCYIVISERPNQVLVIFLGAVAAVTLLFLTAFIILFCLNCRRRRQNYSLTANNKRFTKCKYTQAKNEAKSPKTLTIEIQGDVDEHSNEIEIKPGDIVVIDNNNLKSINTEDLGYISEIVKYYNNKNTDNESMVSIRKKSLTPDTPSVLSLSASETGNMNHRDFRRELHHSFDHIANGHVQTDSDSTSPG